jgi:hypothetical protein
MMFAATIFAERSLPLNARFAGFSFCHVGHPIGKQYVSDYLRLAGAPQVPVKIVSCTSLHRESPKQLRSLHSTISKKELSQILMRKGPEKKYPFPGRGEGHNFRPLRNI